MSDRLLAWFSVSFMGRHLHRALHAQDRQEACVFCRVVWWRLFEKRLNEHHEAASRGSNDV